MTTDLHDLHFLKEERRLGEFWIAPDWMFDARVRRLLSTVIVVSMKLRFESIRYKGFCPDFDVSVIAKRCPVYQPVIDSTGATKFLKLDGPTDRVDLPEGWVELDQPKRKRRR